jgi:hypothetical protein
MIKAKIPNRRVSLSLSLKRENKSMFANDSKEIICGYSSQKILKNSILEACGFQNYKYNPNPKTCTIHLYAGPWKRNLGY